MADVNFFEAFGYKWALVGPAENLQDDQYKLGWGFIGPVPPSVEQFNRVHQVADEKANYLYAQLKEVFDFAAEIPSAGATDTLLLSIQRALGGFRTQTVLTAGAGSFVVPDRCTLLKVRGWAGGGGGGGALVGGAAVGGGGGGYFEGYISVTPGASISYAVGAGGAAGVGNVSNGTNGGTTSFGAFATATGGPGGNSVGTGGASGVGGGTSVAAGMLALPGGGSAASYLVGGVWLGSGGGNSPMGGSISAPTNAGALAAHAPGGGGGGGANGANGAPGAAGLMIIEA